MLEPSVVWWMSPRIAYITNYLPSVKHSSRSPIPELVLSPPINFVEEEVIPSVAPRALDKCGVYPVCKRCWRTERHCEEGECTSNTAQANPVRKLHLSRCSADNAGSVMYHGIDFPYCVLPSFRFSTRSSQIARDVTYRSNQQGRT